MRQLSACASTARTAPSRGGARRVDALATALLESVAAPFSAILRAAVSLRADEWSKGWSEGCRERFRTSSLQRYRLPGRAVLAVH